MSLTHFRVGSSALGEREDVYVHLYDTPEEMATAAVAFNGYAEGREQAALGVTQAWTDQDDRTTAVVIRLCREHLGTQVISHEMHHAATALYGAHVGDRISRRAHLNHWNEPFAHLYSDLLRGLVDRLHALGCYDRSAR